MTLVGLTGKICAGKNFIAGIFEQHGINVLDVDTLGHTALENKKNLVCNHFGNSILRPDGSIDRRVLGQRVFGNRQELDVLEQIVHPEVENLTHQWLQHIPKTGQVSAVNTASSLCVINAALLHKTSVADKLALVVLVDAPAWLRMYRLKKRDHLGIREILRRIKSQKNLNHKFLFKNADIVYIRNIGIGFFRAWEKRIIEKRIKNVILHKFGIRL
ncbi:MAG: dephospho-CoA kinase [Spirochaetaceae bacterium]|jgi:dephospho-CoA kinase|nr:dephospho-CoA kinase [Spirochaetaceae bacterium]